MPSIRIRLAAVGAVLLIVAAVVAAHIAMSPAYANGRVVEFDRRIAGAYEIALGKIPPSPVVSNDFYLSILLTDAETENPVIDASVVVFATGPAEDNAAAPEIGPITVSPDPDTQNYPGYYDTEQAIVPDRPGAWVFTVSVDSPTAGAATAEFPVEVTALNPITGIITLVALLAFIVVVALAIRMYIRERHRSRSS